MALEGLIDMTETNFQRCVELIEELRKELGKGEHGELCSPWYPATINESLTGLRECIREIQKRWD